MRICVTSAARVQVDEWRGWAYTARKAITLMLLEGLVSSDAHTLLTSKLFTPPTLHSNSARTGRPGMWFNKNGLITSALVRKNPASLFQLRASQFPLQSGAGALGPKQIALSNASRYLDMWRSGGHSGRVRIREVPEGFACHGAPILPRG